jgi:hypothetical protein
MSERELTLILYKRRNGQLALAACRGLNKGCAKTIVESERRKLKKPCPDCMPCDDPNETIWHVVERISRGGA